MVVFQQKQRRCFASHSYAGSWLVVEIHDKARNRLECHYGRRLIRLRKLGGAL